MTITLSPRMLRLTVVLLLVATGVVAGMAVSAAMAGAAVEDVSYTAVTPCAAFDSRFGTGPFDGPYKGSQVSGTFSPGNMKTLRVTGSGLTTNSGETQGANDDCGIPPGASAVHINIVAIQAQTVGNLVVVDSGGTPSGGIVTYQVLSPGLNNSNAHTVPLSASGELDIYANCGNNCIIDTVEVRGVVLGYYTDGLASRVAALEALLADVTRTGLNVTFPGNVGAVNNMAAGNDVFAGNDVIALHDVIAFNDLTADNAPSTVLCTRCTLTSADLYRANLTGANLFVADLRSTDLRFANLSAADLRSADLTGADLTGADLADADLFFADLNNAALGSADLTGANLSGADLTDASLFIADLTGADLTNVLWSNTTCPDGTNSDTNGTAPSSCIGHL